MYSLPLSLSLIAILFALLPLAFFIMSRWNITPAQAGWNWAGWRTLLQALSWGTLLSLLATVWMRLLLASGNYLAIPTSIKLIDCLWLLLLVPLAEEILFRGVIFAGFRRNWHISWAILLSAMVNLLLFPMQQWLAYSFIAAIVYALAFHLSRSLWAAIIAHMLVSANIILLFLHPHLASRVSWSQIITGALCALLILLISTRWAK